MLSQLEDLPLDLVLDEHLESSVLDGESTSSSFGITGVGLVSDSFIIGVGVMVTFGAGLLFGEFGERFVRSSMTDSKSVEAVICCCRLDWFCWFS